MFPFAKSLWIAASLLSLRRVPAVVLSLVLASAAAALEIAPQIEVALLQGGGATYTVLNPEALVVRAENHLRTSNPGTFTGPSVGDLIGADRFYNAGYFGANTTTANIEAGHLWNLHETMTHVTTFVHHAPSGGQIGETDLHATWVSHAIGGRPSGNDTRSGIAPDTNLVSGAIANDWPDPPYSLAFNGTFASYYHPYSTGATSFGTADVINSSWGFTDPEGDHVITINYDGLARANPGTTMVMSAGNAGPATNTVGSPGSGYNGITIGAAANNGSNVYDSVASFSSRGPQSYSDPDNGTTAGVRAAVDIIAPGDTLTLAHYGGTTGGNDGGSDPSLGGTTFYNFDLGGTSFASPIVAGGVALMKDAAMDLSLPATALDTRVVKAALLNSADKIPGWDNGQAAHGNGNGGVNTTQGLDYASGAGAMNLDTTFDQYLTGQTDIVGASGGTTTQAYGWDMAEVSLGGFTDTVLDVMLEGGTMFNTTLTWFRDRTSVNSSTASDNGYSDLNLQVWDDTFTTLFSESVSPYNNTEHLSFLLPADGKYGLRTTYDSNLFGVHDTEIYGLAWSGVASNFIPEPGSLAIWAMFVPALTHARRRRRDACHTQPRRHSGRLYRHLHS